MSSAPGATGTLRRNAPLLAPASLVLGIGFVLPLANLAAETMFTGAVSTGSGRPHLGAALLDSIRGATALLREKGLDPA